MALIEERVWRRVEYVECRARGQTGKEGWFCDIKHGEIGRAGSGPFEEDVDVDLVQATSFRHPFHPDTETGQISADIQSGGLSITFSDSKRRERRGTGTCILSGTTNLRTLSCHPEPRSSRKFREAPYGEEDP